MAKLSVWGIATGHFGYLSGLGTSWQPGPNSAGGVSVKWSFKNETGKIIRYAVFQFTPYNRVYDVVKCSIRGFSSGGVRYTGPLESGSICKDYCWENAWYNPSITSVRLDNVHVTYMDGTEEIISGADLSLTAPPGANGCGCYVATAVYGSYDCPQVWTLRRFRDNTLAETWYGRAFIRTYYTISPTLVKWFGKSRWFVNLWKPRLDRMVKKLNERGVEDTPYDDKIW